jgi:hypothetical protein
VTNPVTTGQLYVSAIRPARVPTVVDHKSCHNASNLLCAKDDVRQSLAALMKRTKRNSRMRVASLMPKASLAASVRHVGALETEKETVDGDGRRTVRWAGIRKMKKPFDSN